MTARAHTSTLLPRTGPTPGAPLWGAPPRRQPIAPLILMAIVLLLIAAPSAFAGNGKSGNPLQLLRDIAASTYELTQLMGKSNASLEQIETSTGYLSQLQQDMEAIADSTAGMSDKTKLLTGALQGVGESVSGSRTKLASVDGKLATTRTSIDGIRTGVTSSLGTTKGVVGEFKRIDTAIGAMDTSLERTVEVMSKTGPLTTSFSSNVTRTAIPGGQVAKFGVANYAADNRVMGVVLPLIRIMQTGGPLPARKDSHEAAPLIGPFLDKLVPNGANVAAILRPYDGFYGLPDENYFVQHSVHGF